MAADELELERLVRKLSYHESIILKILASSTCSTKIVIVKEKIEQFEDLVHEIPDSQSELFEEYMDKVVKLWDSYSAAASEAGHRPPTPTATAYPQPTKTVVKSNSSAFTISSLPEYHRTHARSNHCGKDRKKLHRGFARNCGDDHLMANSRRH